MDVAASPTLALGVLGASLLGSLHCAAMCGGFACLYGGDAATRRRQRRRRHAASASSARGRTLTGHVAYHGGRLVAYAMLGALAGTLGAGLDALGAAGRACSAPAGYSPAGTAARVGRSRCSRARSTCASCRRSCGRRHRNPRPGSSGGCSFASRSRRPGSRRRARPAHRADSLRLAVRLRGLGGRHRLRLAGRRHSWCSSGWAPCRRWS